MTIDFVPFLENLIERRRFPRLTCIVLVSGYVLSRLLRRSKLQRLVLQGMLLSIDHTAHRGTREKLLLRYAKSHKLSWSVLIAYIKAPYAATPDSWLDAFPFNADFEAAARGWVLRSEGRIDKAIAALSALRPKDYELALLIVDALREMYHQQQNHEMVASTLVGFLTSEPNRILIKYAVGAAGSAEAVHRDDLFAAAVFRLFGDIKRVLSHPTLFNTHWKDALEGSLSVFDIDGAVAIAQRARAHGLPASKLLNNTLALREELAPILHVVDEARRDLMERCGMRKEVPRVGDAVIVMPAAALRTNRIDYSGFRSDIRSCLKNIVATLEEDRVPFIVKSRIRNHGSLNFNVPFFSYHTIADEPKGLHFKETDRQGLFSFDSLGYAGWSSFANSRGQEAQIDKVDQIKANEFFESDKALFIKSRQSKYHQKEVMELLPKRYLFVALQVMGDAVQRLAFATPFEMLDEVLIVAERFGLEVVVKRHPTCKSPEISRYLASRSDDLFLSEGSIHDLVSAAEAICVINSGVGAEALIYEKPVYVFGRSDYMNACHICQRAGDFTKLYVPGATRLLSDDLRKFWYIYRNIYACNVRDAAHAVEFIQTRVRQHLNEARRLQ